MCPVQVLSMCQVSTPIKGEGIIGKGPIGHFGYIKCGTGQTLQGVTRVPEQLLPMCQVSTPIKGEGIIGKGPNCQFSQATLPIL